jgi:hypothetical protein
MNIIMYLIIMIILSFNTLIFALLGCKGIGKTYLLNKISSYNILRFNRGKDEVNIIISEFVDIPADIDKYDGVICMSWIGDNEVFKFLCKLPNYPSNIIILFTQYNINPHLVTELMNKPVEYISGIFTDTFHNKIYGAFHILDLDIKDYQAYLPIVNLANGIINSSIKFDE